MTATVLQFRPNVARAHCVTCGKIATQTETRAGMAYTVCDDCHVAPPAPARAALESLSPKETAAAIRGILRKAFPACKFSVVTERGSMMSSVCVDWTDGPTAARVTALVNQFEAGHFDGMTDSYDYDRDRSVIVDGQTYRPGTRYVNANRHNSPLAVMRALNAVLSHNWAWKTPEIGAQVVAMRDKLAAIPCQANVDAMYPAIFCIYPGDVQGIGQGRDLSQMLRESLEDASAYGPPALEAAP